VTVDDAFRAEMAAGYSFDEPVVVLGSPIQGDEVLPDVRVQVPLSRVNRHGLIAGATGTGKTKTLQLLAGQLSALGVPVFAVDVKGDLSGVGAPGDPANPAVVSRVESMKLDYVAQGHPIEVLSLSGKQGAHVRASISSFGPLLLGKVLDLNDTQTSILSLVYRYCDDEHLPLLDLADLRTTLKFLGSDEGKPVLAELGGRVHPGRLEQVGVLRADAVQAHEVGVVDPLEQLLRRDPGRRRENLAASGRAAGAQQVLGRGDAGRLQLRCVRRPDALDVNDLHPRSPFSRDGAVGGAIIGTQDGR
jgi:hypothetical protein